MKLSFRILAAAFVLLPAVRAETFSPEGAAVFALRENRDLAAARFVIAEAEGRLVQAGLWGNPEFKAANQFATTDGGDWEVAAGFSQGFPLAGRLRKAKAVARVDVAMAIEELREQGRALAGQVLGKARALLVVDRKVAINEDDRQLLSRIFRQTTSLAATGKAGVADARVIELEQTTLDLARDELLVERRAVVSQLNGLLGRAPGARLAITGSLPGAPTPEVLERAAATGPGLRPELRLAILQADRASSEEVLARAEKWQDLSLGVDLSREREMGMHDTMVSLEVSVPLPFWNRNQGRIEEARAAQMRAITSASARELAIAAEIREAQLRVSGLAQIVEGARGTALNLARRNTELLEETYASGTTSFLTVFESRRQRLMIEQRAIEAEEKLAAAVTDWEMRTMHFPKPIAAAVGAAPCPGK